MKAIVVTDQAAGTAGMKLVERPEPQGAVLASLSARTIAAGQPPAWAASPSKSHAGEAPRSRAGPQYRPDVIAAGGTPLRSV